MDKKALRAQIRQQKRQMSPEQVAQASKVLCDKFLQLPQYRQAKTIYLYLPYNQEVRTEAIFQQALLDGKRVAVPKIYGDVMEFIYITDLSQVAPGCCTIPEPIADGPIARDPNALVLMPGLAFDKDGHRIGYGGGYYDKYLSEEPGHPTVALCYAFQMLEYLQTEPHDIVVDCVIWA